MASNRTQPIITPDEDALNIFTDGSSLPSPRRGGIGVIFVRVDPVTGDLLTDDIPCFGIKGGDSGEMELEACVTALTEALKHEWLTDVNKVVIFSDSQYVVEGYRKAPYWKKQKWVGAYGRPIENAQLWTKLLKLVNKIAPKRVKLEWVKGHSKSEHNKAADRAAKRSAKGFLKEPSVSPVVRRKKTAEFTVVGSVAMKGQELDIRIAESEWFPVQRLSRYRYEVIAPNSEYHGKVDFIFADRTIPILRPVHEYTVRVNSDTKNPRIVELGLFIINGGHRHSLN